jgi:hypothetical protein
LAVRLQLILPTDKVAAIDQFRFQARMPSRAAAVRELLRRGLASADKEQETPKSRGSTGAPRSVTTCALPQYGRAGIYRWLPRLPGSASRGNRSKPPTQDRRRLIRYMRRWLVERFFAWIQWQRRILIRWEYHAHNFLGFVQLACLVILFKQSLAQ